MILKSCSGASGFIAGTTRSDLKKLPCGECTAAFLGAAKTFSKPFHILGKRNNQEWDLRTVLVREYF